MEKNVQRRTLRRPRGLNSKLFSDAVSTAVVEISRSHGSDYEDDHL